MLRNIMRRMYIPIKKIAALYVKYFYNLNPKLANEILYLVWTRKILNLSSPKTFDDKINWLKLYWQHPLVVESADKYKVRKFCYDNNMGEILNEIWGPYYKAEDIDWDILPEKFVLKTNNSTGTNLICMSKATFNKTKAERTMNNWLKQNPLKNFTQRHYLQMEPVIIAEKYIESDVGEIPTDYKFFCFNGEPKFLSVVRGRTSDDLTGKIYKTYFNLDWEEIKLEKTTTDELIEKVEKPKTYNKMLYYARELSKEFPFVRVDFYEGEIYPILGELTFTPSGGIAPYYKDDVQLKLGEMLELPTEIINSNW